MHITLRQLEIFRAIALRGGTTAATELVPLSQSAISAALNELERSLKTRLFDRVGKRLILNDDGRTLLPAAVSLLDGALSLETAFSESSDRITGNLRLIASTTIGNFVLPALIASFVRQAAQIAELNLAIGNTQEVIAAVTEFRADLGFIEGPCRSPELRIQPWLADELVLVTAPDHPLQRSARDRRVSAEALRAEVWLLRERGSGTREVVEEVLLRYLKCIPPSMTLGSTEAIKSAAAERLGIGCLSRHSALEALESGRLQVLDTTMPRITRQFALVHHRDKVLSRALTLFVQHCMGAARPGLPAPGPEHELTRGSARPVPKRPEGRTRVGKRPRKR